MITRMSESTDRVPAEPANSNGNSSITWFLPAVLAVTLAAIVFLSIGGYVQFTPLDSGEAPTPHGEGEWSSERE